MDFYWVVQMQILKTTREAEGITERAIVKKGYGII